MEVSPQPLVEHVHGDRGTSGWEIKRGDERDASGWEKDSERGNKRDGWEIERGNERAGTVASTIWKGKKGPVTPIREVLANSEAVLEFLKTTNVGVISGGALNRGKKHILKAFLPSVSRYSSLSLFPLFSSFSEYEGSIIGLHCR